MSVKKSPSLKSLEKRTKSVIVTINPALDKIVSEQKPNVKVESAKEMFVKYSQERS